jgi:hypothetical protein
VTSWDDFTALFDVRAGFMARMRTQVASSSERGGLDQESALALQTLNEYGPRVEGTDFAPRPLVDAAGHLHDFALQMVEGRTPRVDDSSLAYWSSVGMFPRWSRLLDQEQASADGSQADDHEWCELLGQWLDGSLPAPRASVAIPVLFVARDEESSGVATLTLESLPDGPPGLFAHPAMSLFYGDEQFAASLSAAWFASQAPADAPVLWSLRSGDFWLDHLRGNSCGAALAVGLTHLNRRLARPPWRPMRRLDSSVAITAAVTPNGELDRVSDVEEKAKTAAHSGLRALLVSKLNADEIKQLTRNGELLVADVSNVAEAERRMRRRVPKRRLAAAALVVLSLSIAGIVLAIERNQAARVHNAGLLREAQNLREEATGVKGDAALSRQTEARLLLAGESLASRGGSSTLAQQISSSTLTSQSGVLQAIAPSLAGAVLHLTQVGNEDDLLADTETGRLALIDPQTYDLLGTYTIPPGTESLNQPTVQSIANLPGSDLVAVVIQDAVTNLAGLYRGASLVVFSAAGDGLTKIGEDTNFTTAPVTAAAYWHEGTRLLTATDTEVTYWDTTSNQPEPLGTCRWRRTASLAKPVIALDDARRQRPLLVLSSGEVVELPPWRAAVGKTCFAPVLMHAVADETKSDSLVQETVSAAFGASGQLRTFAVTRSHQLVETAQSVAPRVLAKHVVGIGPIEDEDIPLRIEKKGQSRLEFLAVSGKQPTVEGETYEHESLPAVHAQGVPFAVNKAGTLDSLDPDRTAYVPAGVTMGLEGNVVNAVSAGRNTVALAYPFGFGVYGLTPRAPAKTVPFPAGFQLGAGDGRFNATFSLSPDGRYVAAILDGGHPPGRPKLTNRSVYIYDVAAHQVMALPPARGSFLSETPLTLGFAPTSDQLLVSWNDGELLSYTLHQGRWRVAVWHRSEKYSQDIAAAVDADGLYRLESGPPYPAQVVVRYDLRGRRVGTWKLGSVSAKIGMTPPWSTLAQIVPIDGHGALLVLDSGTSYLLRPDGRVSAPIELGDNDILSGTVVRTAHQVFLAGYGGLVRVNYLNGTVEPQSELGSLTAIASADDGRYLVASDPLFANALLLGLTQNSRVADLCEMAGGLSRATWTQYVSGGLSYEPVCATFQEQLEVPALVARASERLVVPENVAVILPQDITREEADCRQAGSSPTSGAIGVLRWKLPSPGNPGAVCHEAQPIWSIPPSEGASVQAGGSAASPLLLVGAEKSATDPDPSAELIDASGTVALRLIIPAKQISLEGFKASVATTVGNLKLTTTFHRLGDTEAWDESLQEPVGAVNAQVE